MPDTPVPATIRYFGNLATAPAVVMDDLLLRVNVAESQVAAVLSLLAEVSDAQGFVSIDRIHEALEGAAPEGARS